MTKLNDAAEKAISVMEQATASIAAAGAEIDALRAHFVRTEQLLMRLEAEYDFLSGEAHMIGCIKGDCLRCEIRAEREAK